ncbi:WecB/TagA/CpsF family glycosyltransferase [Rhizobium redzepovicii]|uniref:WecB/TagA/CpsF family glycosyltransferase n=1 Tax=Rhizobium redzepovicii TaxID=2867518 RepID=A0AAW8PBE8_9HYPH|nr:MULTISPECIES: WecB/TagA/CpsF family glycosyltransferase [Rhizobium]MBY4591763.1 WecB/TagA/CpsF family glycosyltransferase [Rhizobium redzepovicii]MBY4616338.1 WecB/TagA/CpsF family glycosyltransferase [Rhizobium redzepovicii]MDF0662413.1 WecB/TagA/CpsF family glycosyltransferase [Rhizobium sp. BC49]MDR9764328.1 WecB/TagA/CpsF family glycosyltransferase [Rhizobium redzepovicii]MDR9784793.1 WecB/TagA/CpsF family glycosyltransferase [Rhizobium redzepovicii]
MRKQAVGSSPTSVLHPEGSLGWTNVLGVRVSAVNLKSATEFIQKAIEDGRKEYVCVRDAHGIVRCQDDPELRSIHNRAFLVTPDGMPLVWALRKAGHAESGRVYGPDLMLSVFDAGSAKGLRHFLYGATAETLEQLQARLLAKFPQAQIVGSYAPPFRKLSTQEEADIADKLNRSGADIIWVGLSSPKQELWMAHMRDRLEASMLIGVGAAFDFHAGLKRQAPRFIQRSGFEWAFRLLCEPRRLWRRYALVVPTFISLSAFQRLGLRQFPIEDAISGSGVSGQMQ